ncbi:MAG: hypothetical protein AB1430_16635 [Pseudomonadota bacterium]
MICAEVIPASASAPATFSPVASQPLDMTACEAVILTGQDAGIAALFSFPSATDLGTAFGVGFTLVVSGYLIGWAVGSVLNFIERN